MKNYDVIELLLINFIINCGKNNENDRNKYEDIQWMLINEMMH